MLVVVAAVVFIVLVVVVGGGGGSDSGCRFGGMGGSGDLRIRWRFRCRQWCYCCLRLFSTDALISETLEPFA